MYVGLLSKSLHGSEKQIVVQVIKSLDQWIKSLSSHIVSWSVLIFSSLFVGLQMVLSHSAWFIYSEYRCNRFLWIVVGTFQPSFFYYILEERNFHSHCCGILKSQELVFLCMGNWSF